MISKIHVSRLGALSVGAAFTSSGLSELLIEPDSGANDVGHIYLGQVQRVVDGIDGAFVTIDRNRNGFLPIVDHRSANAGSSSLERRVRPNQSQPKLKQGTWLPVQVVRPECGNKSARLTQELSFPSLYVVFYPHRTGIAVSKKISDRGELVRLEHLGREALNRAGLENALRKAAAGGLMFRTLSQNVTEALLIADIQRVMAQWEFVRSELLQPQVMRCLHRGQPNPVGWIQQWLSRDLSEILVDDEKIVPKITDYLSEMMPEWKGTVKPVAESAKRQFRQRFTHILDELLCLRVELPSGGYLVVEETEAMSTIDVNTGADVAGADLAATALRTNLEAAQRIPRELKLRNLAGLVAIDFIDMVDPEHQQQVRNQLLKACQDREVPCRVSEFSDFGIVQISKTQRGLSLGKQIRSGGRPARSEGSNPYSAHLWASQIVEQVQKVLILRPSSKIEIRASSQVLIALFGRSDFVSILEARMNGIQIEAVTDWGICELRVDDQAMSLDCLGESVA
ncbi:MAG: ribonuclease E/G [Pseudomonadales bacterium]